MTPHVLMIDDNPGDLQLIEEAFKDSRVQVTFLAATEGQSALDYLARAANGDERRPDVLILDLNIPGMSGREILDNVRAQPTWRSLPVVVLSGEQVLSESLAVDEIVRKPDTYAKYCALAQRLQRYWSGPARRSDHAPVAVAAVAAGAAAR